MDHYGVNFGAAVDEPAEAFLRARLAFLTQARGVPERRWPRLVSAWRPVRDPRTTLPGGRGPRCVAPVRCAGRSAAPSHDPGSVPSPRHPRSQVRISALCFGQTPESGLDYRAVRGYSLATVDEPARGLCVPGSRSSPRHEAFGAYMAPAGICLVGLLVSPRTMLPGGRGPRCVAPVRRAGRSTAPPTHSRSVASGAP